MRLHHPLEHPTEDTFLQLLKVGGEQLLITPGCVHARSLRLRLTNLLTIKMATYCSKEAWSFAEHTGLLRIKRLPCRNAVSDVAFGRDPIASSSDRNSPSVFDPFLGSIVNDLPCWIAAEECGACVLGSGSDSNPFNMPLLPVDRAGPLSA